MLPTEDSPELGRLLQIHALCAAFESRWQLGERPQIEEYLATADDTLRLELLRALLLSELEIREDRGERWEDHEYASRFPHFGPLVNEVLNRDSLATTGSPRVVAAPGQTVWRVAHYAVLEEIARGGMGVVYRARDDRLGRIVALKVILGGHFASAAEVHRFEMEARTVSRLDHPGIVSVYEFGEWGGHRYLVMPLVAGSDLSKRLEGGAISPREAATWLRQIADAVQFAHQAGVIHRDLKPRNILLDASDRPRVTDFGLAKIIADETFEVTQRRQFADRASPTLTGQILGTPSYMSPEQASGHHELVGPATDVYALGAILYEMLSGEPPFRAATLLETLRQIQDSTPASLYRTSPHVARDLLTICEKCLEKNPAARYRTAQELVNDLDRYLAGRPIHARRIGSFGHLTRWVARHRTVSLLLGLLFGLLLFLATGASIAAILLNRAKGVAVAATDEAIKSELARRLELARIYMNEARSAAAMADADARRNGTASIRSALKSIAWEQMDEPLRQGLIESGIAITTMTKLTTVASRSAVVANWQFSSPHADIDPAFQHIVVQGGRPDATSLLRAMDERIQDTPFVSPVPTNERFLSSRLFSGNGQWVAEVAIYLDGSRRTMVWNTADHNLQLDVPFGGAQVVFHPHESKVLLFVDEQFFQVYDLTTGALVSSSPARFRGGLVAYSADGTLLAKINSNIPVEVLSAETWLPVVVLNSINEATSIVWDSTGHRLFVGDGKGRIHLCDETDHWEPQLFSHDHQHPVARLCVSPDGRYLASGDDSNQLSLRRIDDPTNVVRQVGTPLRFSQESKRLAILSNDIISVVLIEEPSVLRKVHVDAFAAVYSPDGRWLGVSSLNGSQLFDATTLTPIANLGLDPSGPIAFHPQGHELATFGKFSQVRRWTWGGTGANTLGPSRSAVSSVNKPWHGRLAPQHSGRTVAYVDSGQTLLTGNGRLSRVELIDCATGQLEVLATMRDPRLVVASHDGRWIAAANHLEACVHVWNATTKERVLSVPDHRSVAFSNDGRWLATSNGLDCVIYDVSQWKQHCVFRLPQLPSFKNCPMTFHPHQGILAVAGGDQNVHLFDVPTRRLLARLHDHSAIPCRWLSFHPSGHELAVTGGNHITVWNLVSLRRELVDLGLSSDMATLGTTTVPAGSSNHATSPITVARGDLPPADQWYTLEERLARYEAFQKRWPDAIDNLNKALQLVDHQDHEAIARLRSERGSYSYRNLSPESARSDWIAVLQRDPENELALRGLARLELLGPPSFQNPSAAQYRGEQLGSRAEWATFGRFLGAVARARQGAATDEDRQTLQQVAEQTLTMDTVESSRWQLPSAYLLALEAGLRRDRDAAARHQSAAESLRREKQESLSADERDELERLAAEVQRLTELPP